MPSVFVPIGERRLAHHPLNMLMITSQDHFSWSRQILVQRFDFSARSYADILSALFILAQHIT